MKYNKNIQNLVFQETFMGNYYSLRVGGNTGVGRLPSINGLSIKIITTVFLTLYHESPRVRGRV